MNTKLNCLPQMPVTLWIVWNEEILYPVRLKCYRMLAVVVAVAVGDADADGDGDGDGSCCCLLLCSFIFKIPLQETQKIVHVACSFRCSLSAFGVNFMPLNFFFAFALALRWCFWWNFPSSRGWSSISFISAVVFDPLCSEFSMLSVACVCNFQVVRLLSLLKIILWRARQLSLFLF